MSEVKKDLGPFCFRCPPELRERIDAAAKADGMSRSAFLSMIVGDKLDDLEDVRCGGGDRAESLRLAAAAGEAADRAAAFRRLGRS